MNQMRQFATNEDLAVIVTGPFTEEEINDRHLEYDDLSFSQFKKKYRQVGYRPVTLDVKGKTYEIQVNVCTNPFCQFYGLPQHTYESIKRKPKRYRFMGAYKYTKKMTDISGHQEDPVLRCNPIEDKSLPGISLENSSSMMSNWSLADEIARLIRINEVVPIQPKYEFHREGCPQLASTPFEQPKDFYKRGKSSSNSQKYQCKVCKKMTNVLPKQNQSFNYHQQRNDILLPLAKDILSRTPVTRTIKKLDIGIGTYYAKLDWIYRKCLEFLERHETKVLQEKSFDTLFLATDSFMYHLNYKRIRSDGTQISRKEDKLPTTYISASADIESGYVFRADVAFDFDITLEEIEETTQSHHCDHSYGFNRKHERLRHEYAPQYPTYADSQSIPNYEIERALFEDKKSYVDGLHIKPQYTAMAHYWLLKQQLKVKQWWLISDNDNTIQTALFRIFKEEVATHQANVIACQHNKALTLQESYKYQLEKRKEMEEWAALEGFSGMSFSQTLRTRLELDLICHDFYDWKLIDGDYKPIKSVTPYYYPYPFKDEGERQIIWLTDIHHIDVYERARVAMNAHLRPVDTFFQEIHRSLSVLERPLNTSRGDGRSYIYTNYNPKYAQQLVTILRVFQNFCDPIGGKEKLTPAQRLGIANKVYDLKDIIYFK